MIKYEIKKGYEEISWKDRKKIMPAVAVQVIDSDPELIASFDTLEEAKNELKKYESVVWLTGGSNPYYDITEYYIEENEYNEDGDWIDGGNVWEYSKMELSKIAE